MFYKVKNLYSGNKVTFTSSIVRWIQYVVLERKNKTCPDSCDMFWLNEIIQICDFLLVEEKVK